MELIDQHKIKYMTQIIRSDVKYRQNRSKEGILPVNDSITKYSASIFIFLQHCYVPQEKAASQKEQIYYWVNWFEIFKISKNRGM